MSDLQSRHDPSLGVSIGATNLAATLGGPAAAIRPAELTVHGQRLTGFVDRIGDPVPLIAADGSLHHADRLVTAAVSALTHELTRGASVRDTTVAVPAHWPASVVENFRRATRLPVVSDAAAALTALRADPGLPTRGVIVLCDFGGSGTTVSLADAASDFAPIGQPVRFADFSGEHIDQALLRHVAAGLPELVTADAAGTALVGSLSRLRDECRSAKERLSAWTATAVPVDLPGNRSEIRVTRTELDDLVLPAFATFLVALDETLERAGIAAASVSAVATVGGTARIPLITQRLSEHLRAPIVTTARPHLVAAEGAAIIARRSRVVEAPTTVAPAGEPSAPFRALAWSEDVPVEPDFAVELDARPEVQFLPNEWADPEPEPRRSPIVLFGLAAGAAVLASVVFVLTSFGSDTMTPVEAATPVAPSPTPAAPVVSPAAPAPQVPTVTTVVAQPAPRSNSVPQRPQAPVTQHPPAEPTAENPPTTDPTTPPTTEAPPTSETPATPDAPENPATPETPPPPPIDPGAGNGETPGTGETNPPPIDPGPGDGTGTTTPPIDPGDGAAETDAGAPADGAGSPGA